MRASASHKCKQDRIGVSPGYRTVLCSGWKALKFNLQLLPPVGNI
uniref:Uncharacterized protein n=1 Tax=Setaria viridis TaxID=4556 RepID=A0A4U6V6N8_SETVI|nr:hypothetical protein SEVIR_3G079800v2 [Setaria viridis]